MGDEFQDLLPAEVARSPPSVPRPMRPAPPPPPGPLEAARTAAAAPSPPPGRPCTTTTTITPTPAESALFSEADADGDGRVAGAEAKAFFERTGLPPATLAAVWDAAVAAAGADGSDAPGTGLGPVAFAAACRLAAIAQAGGRVEAGAAATRTGGPPPALAPAVPANVTAGPRLERAPTVGDAAAPSLSRRRSSSGAGGAGVASAAASGELAGNGAGSLVDDAWGGSALPVVAGVGGGTAGGATAATAATASGPLDPPPPVPPPAPPTSRPTLRHASTAASGRLDSAVAGSGAAAAALSAREPVAVDVRCAPLRPKEGARLARLACGGGCIFAAPSLGGGALQWAGADDGRPAVPSGAPRAAAPAPGEDADAAPSAEVHPPPSAGGSGRAPTATAVLYEAPPDPSSSGGGALWLGFDDGRVARYDLSAPGAYASSAHPASWLAHRGVAVTALALTLRGELWTGSARGAVRVWRPASGRKKWPPAAAAAGGGDVPSTAPSSFTSVGSGGADALAASAAGAAADRDRPRELRRLGGARPHGSAVLALVAPSPGSTVWSVGGGRSVCVWCARTGAWLGVIEPPGASSAAPPSFTAPPPLAPGGGPSGGGAVAASDAIGAWDYDSWGDGGSSAALSALGPDPRRSGGAIDPTVGLEADAATGAPVGVPPPADRPRLEADQRAWAAGADTRSAELLGSVAAAGGKAVESAGKAARLLGRLGARVVRGLGGGGGGGGGWEAAGGGEGAAAPLRALGADPADDDVTRAAGGPSAVALATAGVAAIDVGDGGPGAAVAAAGRADGGGARCLAALPDGTVVVGFKAGRVDAYSPLGRRLWSVELRRGLACLAAVHPPGSSPCSAPRIWVGLADGGLAVLDAAKAGAALGAWRAHPGGATVALSPAGARLVYSLGADGTVKAWSAASPSPSDVDGRVALAAALPRLTATEAVSALALTWNVGQARPPPTSPLFACVADLASGADIAIACLQEIEMGSGSVALAAAREAVLPSSQERGNATAQWWAASLQAALGGPGAWARVGLRQLSGMLVLVYARVHLAPAVGDVRTSAVPTGVLGVGGNKGGVGVSFSVHRVRCAAVCAHLAAHQGAVSARNANWAAIARGLAFDAKPWYDLGGPSVGEEAGGGHGGGGAPAPLPPPRRGSAAAATTSPGTTRGRWDSSDDEDGSTSPSGSSSEDAAAAGPPPDEGAGLAACDAVVWGGDFNYRIDLPYEDVVSAAASGDLAPLLAADQLAAARAAGRAFVRLREAAIAFRPTYKFDKGDPRPTAYDTSEKRRVPAWTDRILFRGSREGGAEGGGGGGGPGPTATVDATGYGCLPEVCDSDHKPVWAALRLGLAVAPPGAARAAAADALDRAVPAVSAGPAPSASLTPAALSLGGRDGVTAAATLANTSSAPLAWRVVGADADWLDLAPLGGLLAPGASATLVAEAALSDDVFYSQSVQRAVACTVVAVSGGGQVWTGRLEVTLDG